MRRFVVRSRDGLRERDGLLGRVWAVFDREINAEVAEHDSRTLARADAAQMETEANMRALMNKPLAIGKGSR